MARLATSSGAAQAAAEAVVDRSALLVTVPLVVPVEFAAAAAAEAVLLTCQASAGPVVSVEPVPFS